MVEKAGLNKSDTKMTHSADHTPPATAAFTRTPGRAGWIARRPIAHRGLHHAGRGVHENTLTAARLAAEKGYAIEVDLHLARDRVPVVFHDRTLERLTGTKGDVRAHTAAELGRLTVGHGGDRVPTLRQLLATVDGRTGIVLELKGVAGADEGFVAAVAADLADYAGPAAIMSFNHWLLEDSRALAPHLTLGLTAQGDDALLDTHMEIDRRIEADFLSYKLEDLGCRFVTEFRATGRPVISWTVKSAEQAALSARHADQITFEGFLP